MDIEIGFRLMNGKKIATITFRLNIKDYALMATFVPNISTNKECFIKFRDCLEKGEPDTIEFNNSAYISYAGGNVPITFSDGSIESEIIFINKNHKNVIDCIDYVIASDIWNYLYDPSDHLMWYQKILSW